MVKTAKIYVRDATGVSPLMLLLFGGQLEVYQKFGVISVDTWLKFRCSAKVATLIKHLRVNMEDMLLKKIIKPEEDVMRGRQGEALLQAINILLEDENANRPKVLVSKVDVGRSLFGIEGGKGGGGGKGLAGTFGNPS